MAKHSQGPWKVVGVNRDIIAPATAAHNDNGLIACTRYLGNSQEREAEHAANARLISAAPELLEACKLAFERLKPGPVKKDFAGHLAYAALSKAIRKAEEGEE